jgi:cation diffusion facilitator CzcD-associated flavoprotein CzcO
MSCHPVYFQRCCSPLAPVHRSDNLTRKHDSGVPDATVVVVGGGASGLSAAAALTRRGIETVVLEQDARVGGTWERRYDRLRLHTIRRFSGLAHFPIPNRFPLYLSRSDLVEYLAQYVRQFGLRIVTATSAKAIRPPSHSSGAWSVETMVGDLWRGRVVVIATGQYRLPILPPWAGRETFRGRLTHSVSYSNATPYVGQRVLVVGAGNSGAEIATDLSDNGAASVAVSVRTPPPIVPRDPFGLPVQRTSMLSTLPPALANRLSRLTARVVLGDLTRYGMPKGKFAPYTTRRVPVIDVGFVAALEGGRVKVKPALERVSQTGAVFADARANHSTRSLQRRDSAPASSRSSTRRMCSIAWANPSGPQGSRRRTQACISSGSLTACAGTCSRRTARPGGWRGMSSSTWLPEPSEAPPQTIEASPR